MSKRVAVKSGAVLLLVALVSLTVWDNAEQSLPQRGRLLLDYQTSSARTTNVNSYCPPKVDRTTLAPSSELSTAEASMKDVRSQLGVDG